MISIRPAVENDIEAICSLDLIAQRENERREFIQRAVTSGECFVAEWSEKVIGYAVFNYSFYHSGFIEMLYIGSDYRRSGMALLKI
jgi:N-acetylglutamate synthase-like GNAT family acetyltransferase